MVSVSNAISSACADVLDPGFEGGLHSITVSYSTVSAASDVVFFT